jgi:hypothetical protein
MNQPKDILFSKRRIAEIDGVVFIDFMVKLDNIGFNWISLDAEG